MGDANQGKPMDNSGYYGALAAPFDRTYFRDGGGGIRLEYITGEQCISRLNEALGFLAWSFVIVEHGIHAEADEFWVLGELTVDVGERIVKRQQFGSQKLHRSRVSGTPLDIGYDLKGAATDALKKCASLIGVALYLYEKDAPESRGTAGSANQQPAAGVPSGEAVACEDCGETLTETRFKSGDVWSPDQLAMFGRRKHGRVLCLAHYRAAADAAKRRAEEAAF